MATKKLTPKQEMFCREYLCDLNGAQAAIRAGYSPKSANKVANQNLTKLDIQRRVSELMAERSEATGIKANWVLIRLARIADFDLRKLFDAKGALKAAPDLDTDTAYGLSGIDVTEIKTADDQPAAYLKKFRTADRIKALELIGRHLGMWVDHIEHNVSTAAQVIITMPHNNREPLPEATKGGNPEFRITMPHNNRD